MTMRSLIGFTFPACAGRCWISVCPAFPFKVRHLLLTTSAADAMVDGLVVGQLGQLLRPVPASTAFIPHARRYAHQPEAVAAVDAAIVELATLADERRHQPLHEPDSAREQRHLWNTVWSCCDPLDALNCDPAHMGQVCTLSLDWHDATPRPVYAVALGWGLR